MSIIGYRPGDNIYSPRTIPTACAAPTPAGQLNPEWATHKGSRVANLLLWFTRRWVSKSKVNAVFEIGFPFIPSDAVEPGQERSGSKWNVFSSNALQGWRLSTTALTLNCRFEHIHPSIHPSACCSAELEDKHPKVSRTITTLTELLRNILTQVRGQCGFHSYTNGCPRKVLNQ